MRSCINYLLIRLPNCIPIHSQTWPPVIPKAKPPCPSRRVHVAEHTTPSSIPTWLGAGTSCSPEGLIVHVGRPHAWNMRGLAGFQPPPTSKVCKNQVILQYSRVCKLEFWAFNQHPKTQSEAQWAWVHSPWSDPISPDFQHTLYHLK